MTTAFLYFFACFDHRFTIFDIAECDNAFFVRSRQRKHEWSEPVAKISSS